MLAACTTVFFVADGKTRKFGTASHDNYPHAVFLRRGVRQIYGAFGNVTQIDLDRVRLARRGDHLELGLLLVRHTGSKHRYPGASDSCQPVLSKRTRRSLLDQGAL